MLAERSLLAVINVEKPTRQKDNAEGSRIQNAMVRQEAVGGSIKTYQSDQDDPPVNEQIAPVIVEVRARIEDALKEARKYSVPAIDITATKDSTNQVANADLTVDGITLRKDVPISHLLWLEGYFTEWRSFLMKLPILNPTIRWEWDDGKQLYVSPPETTVRNVKEKVPLVLIPPSKEHQGVAETIMKETPTGKFTTVAVSGAVSEHRKQQLLDRAHTLLLAIKDAIARANKTVAVEVREGDAIMDWLLA